MTETGLIQREGDHEIQLVRYAADFVLRKDINPVERSKTAVPDDKTLESLYKMLDMKCEKLENASAYRLNDDLRGELQELGVVSSTFCAVNSYMLFDGRAIKLRDRVEKLEDAAKSLKDKTTIKLHCGHESPDIKKTQANIKYWEPKDVLVFRKCEALVDGTKKCGELMNCDEFRKVIGDESYEKYRKQANTTRVTGYYENGVGILHIVRGPGRPRQVGEAISQEALLLQQLLGKRQRLLSCGWLR